MPLSSTQIGAIGENLLVNAIMKGSNGRLAPFQPLADDDGIDCLFWDKTTGQSVAIQLKCRTVTLYKPGTKERGNQAHFEVRKTTFNETRRAYLVAGLCNEELTGFVVTWLVPMSILPELARNSATKWVIRANKSESSADRFAPYRCTSVDELVQRIIAICEPNEIVAAL
ncbi:hypothetical protein CJO71_20075 [Burkholderia ubonensis]|nr:DUF4365 domain-containing protein [Burkholderia ubonensis]PAJ79175.1 hypothetical protein CJO71_20075 [Burkholderia ubonensis]PAJ98586.1 hypothetical protein CJO68_24145 [Burkholderia ubonensis]RQP84647.1 DUF4365 domain-containing protein [Burkholderia ubonensis]